MGRFDNYEMRRELEYQEVLSKLADIFMLDKDDIYPEATLEKDLGIDSLEMLEMVLDFNTNFGIEFPLNKMADVKTIGELVEVILDCDINPQ